MSSDNEMRKRAEAAARQFKWGKHLGGDRFGHYDMAEFLVEFAAQEIANAKREGAREERRTIYQHVSGQRDWLIINAAAFNTVAVELKIEELDRLLAWLRGREQESEKEK